MAESVILFEQQFDPFSPSDLGDDVLHLAAATTLLRIHHVIAINRLKIDMELFVQTLSADVI